MTDPARPPRDVVRIVMILGAVAASAIAVGLWAVVASRVLEERAREQEAAAIGALRTIATAQTLFREGDKDRDGTLDYGLLRELSAAGLIDAELGAGVKGGYRFEVRPSPSSPELLWFAVANPVEPRPGQRSFCTNHEGWVHVAWAPLSLADGGEACTIPSDLDPLWGPPPYRPDDLFPPEPARLAPIDLSRVRVGQRYRFRIANQGAPPLEIVWEVTSVGEGRVAYTGVTFMDLGQGMEPIGEPTPGEWSVPDLGGPPPDEASLRRERVSVSGLELDCVVTTSGDTTTWAAVSSDLAAFPGVIRVATADGAPSYELVSVEEAATAPPESAAPR